MNDFLSNISEVMSDPEASRKIREIASSLSAGGATTEEPALPDSSSELSVADAPLGGWTPPAVSLHSRECALLSAVRPYLRSSRAEKIDSALRAIRIIDLLSTLR